MMVKTKKKKITYFIYSSSKNLQAHIGNKVLLSDEAVEEFSNYLTLAVDKNTGRLFAFEQKAKTIKQYYIFSGIFACLCNNMDKDMYSLIDILENYRLNNQQEKALILIKTVQSKGIRILIILKPREDIR